MKIQSRTCTHSKQSTFSKILGLNTPILGSAPSFVTHLAIAMTCFSSMAWAMEERATCCEGEEGSAHKYWTSDMGCSRRNCAGRKERAVSREGGRRKRGTYVLRFEEPTDIDSLDCI